MDGILEGNMMGEYRIKATADDPESFKKAVARPGIHLADTTLICLDEEPEE